MKTKMISGNIPAGFSCPYSDECEDKKKVACNGNGCPVCDGKTIDNDFSCGLARLIRLIKGDK